MDGLSKWGWLLGLAFNLAIAWVLWSLRSAFVPRRDFDELAKSVALVERDIAHLPTQDDVAAIRDGLAKVEGKCDAQEAVLNRIAASVTRIEDYLLRAKA